jgi:hypothetical protein
MNLIKKGYKRKAENEYVRILKPNGFPRYHIILKNGKVNLHIDYRRRHGISWAGSIITKGAIITNELKRIYAKI